MKKIGIFLLILCYMLCSIPVQTAAEELQSNTESTIDDEIIQESSAVANGSYSLDALYPLLGSDKLVNNVRSAVVYEANSQTLMYAWNPDVQMYPASFVKILTALLAIEKGALADTVTVSDSAVNSVPYDAVSAKLLAGEMLTLEELIYCLLVGSANDAAAVIAEHISGSQSAFVLEMNEYLLELGCTATQFTNPHGLHDENQHTTARDSAKILNAALKNDIFRTIFTANEYVVKPTNLSPERKLTSGNSMKDSSSGLYYDPRAIGGRTGVTKDGRRCFAAAAESDGMLVISVVMGSESVYQEDGYSAISIGGYKETSQLFDACLSGYKTAQILHAEQVLRQVPVNGANNDLLIGPQISLTTILPKDITIGDLTYRYNDKLLELPISKGDYVSDLQIWHGSMCVAEAQLFAMNEIRMVDGGAANEASVQKNAVPTAIWVVFGITVVVVVIYFLMRFWSKLQLFALNIRKKHYRRSHKREH